MRKETYNLVVRFDPKVKKPLTRYSKNTRWSINDIIVLATERFINELNQGATELKAKEKAK